jgi:glycine/D-amino acid oxidase-like deaminating enzyme
MGATLKDVEVLIVGQGLAGSLLAYFLEKAGLSFHVIDNDGQHSASRKAAGLINPVTGRNFVKTWKADALLSFARQTYQDLEQMLGTHFYSERTIYRALASIKEENDWLARAGEAGYEAYMGPCHQGMELAPGRLSPTPAYGETLKSAQLMVADFLDFYQNYLIGKHWMSKIKFNYSSLHFTENALESTGIQAKILVFCEGYGLKSNPWFDYLPMRGDKGEALIVDFPGLDFEQIVKQNKTFIAPTSSGKHWVGATYAWNFEDDGPSAAAQTQLLAELSTFYPAEKRVVEHWAAIRPTVKDRRPLIGPHPEHPQLWVFNGLGTKGASLAPFWAHHLVEVLQKKTILDAEVDIQRFALLAPHKS